MCKRSFHAFAARPKKREAVADSKVTFDESTQYDEELTIREMIAAGGDLEQIKSSLCGLTNDLHPIFDEKNICVCKNKVEDYCYLPKKLAELEAATDKIKGSLEPTWSHPLENLVLRSAMQLATRFITHEDTLPFWAGLMDCSRYKIMDEARPFRARARKRLDADKANRVLEYLTEVANKIRFHFKPLESRKDGYCTFFCIWPHDPNFDPAWTDGYNYAWRDGKPAVEADAFPHVFLNVNDSIAGCDMSNDVWLDWTFVEIRASIFKFATTIGHEFAHAMVDITQNGFPAPRFNEETVVESGFPWEHFVFGGRLDFDGEGDVHAIPWPSYETWQDYAGGGDTLQLCAIGRGALPYERVCLVERQAWERFFDQGFWEQGIAPEGAFKTLWLRGNDVGYNRVHYFEPEKPTAPPKRKRKCQCEDERQRQRREAVQRRGNRAMTSRPDRWDRVVDNAEESKDIFHGSNGKLILNEFWASCTKHVGQGAFL